MRRLGVLLIICAWALPVSVARAWTWPVDGPVLRPFSFDRAHPYAAGQHRGIDLGAPGGRAVLAPADGVVSFTGGGSDKVNLYGGMIAGQQSLVDNQLGGSMSVTFDQCALPSRDNTQPPKMLSLRELNF